GRVLGGGELLGLEEVQVMGEGVEDDDVGEVGGEVVVEVGGVGLGGDGDDVEEGEEDGDGGGELLGRRGEGGVEEGEAEAKGDEVA
ncbi:hypothetical protein, partial [Pseudomonas aeruginosa]|uniref:hypothetical protein n=1 Tax=Pseudomonas aeruginosa TaxID=287 RepID=UPI0024BDFD4D